MINETNIKVPKKYADLINRLYKDASGYCCVCEKGYWYPSKESDTIHATTQAELLNSIRDIEAIESNAIEEKAVVTGYEAKTDSFDEIDFKKITLELLASNNIPAHLRIGYLTMLAQIEYRHPAGMPLSKWAVLFGVSDRQASRIIQGLTDLGLINKIPAKDSKGRVMVSQYELLTLTGEKVGII